MQENEFEKAIREKMDQLRLVPNDEVWNNVSEKIREDKKRRRFLFFLFSFIFLAGATSFYFITSQNTILHSSLSEHNTSVKRNTFYEKDKLRPTEEIALEKANQRGKQNDDRQAEGINKDETTSKKGIDQIEKSDASNPRKEDYILKSNPAPIAKKQIEANSTVKSAGPGKKINQEAFDEIKENPIQIHPPNSLQGATGQKGKKDQLKQQSSLASDSLKLPSLEENIKKIETLKDSASPLLANIKSSAKPKMQDKKNWRWGLTVFGGISDNLTGLASSGNSSFSYSNANPNSPSAGQSNGGTISKLSYNTALSYGIGVFATKSFSRKISFSTGINYHFLSSISPAGTKISMPQTVYDASLQSNAFVSQVYSPGQSVDYKNKYELLELPVNFLFQFNRNGNRKLFLNTGVTPAYLVGSSALYASTTQNLYYETNEQFKKVLLLVQAGVQLSILQSRGFEITAGPQVQYGLNNMAKSATGTRQHLSSALLKVNIGLK